KPIIAHHSAVLDPLAGLGTDHPLITDTELDRLQDDYVHAAALAAQAGFDGVDVKACHGYLVSDLMAAFTRQKSRYGGSLENRTRLLREVVARIRDEVPGILVTSRINGFDGIRRPYGFGTDEGDPPAPDLSEPVELGRKLDSLGCPMLNVSAGNPYYRPYHGRPFDRPIAGGAVPDEHPLIGIARLVRMTGQLQRAVPSLPMVGTGYSWLRQFFPQVGAAVIRAGKAAFIGLGRMGFAYPDAVADLAEHGALDAKKVCITCSSCSQIMRDGGRAGCIVRDPEVYVPEYRRGRRRAAADE
ncbi:MAG: hypothetical protein JSV91_01195, partial [Phycisphaerales bacterium]